MRERAGCQSLLHQEISLVFSPPRPIYGPSPAPAGRSFRGGGLQGHDKLHKAGANLFYLGASVRKGEAGRLSLFHRLTTG